MTGGGDDVSMVQTVRRWMRSGDPVEEESFYRDLLLSLLKYRTRSGNKV